jgi:hypothetical protein
MRLVAPLLQEETRLISGPNGFPVEIGLCIHAVSTHDGKHLRRALHACGALGAGGDGAFCCAISEIVRLAPAVDDAPLQLFESCAHAIQVWLEEAMKMMIRRAGEVAANPNGPHEQITMDHLPRLPARV